MGEHERAGGAEAAKYREKIISSCEQGGLWGSLVVFIVLPCRGGGGGDWRASTDSHMLVSPVLTFHT